MKCKICGADGLIGDYSPILHFANKHADLLVTIRISDPLNEFIRERFIDEKGL